MLNSLTTLASFVLTISLLIFLFNIRSMFVYLISIELMLLASIINFISYAYVLDSVESEIMIFYILTIAVSESAFGLGLLLRIFRNKGSWDPQNLNDLN